MNINEYIKSELLVLIPVLYLVGIGLKKSKISNKFIPAILGGGGILLSTLWVFATSSCGSRQEVAIGIFTAVTQGILVAGASVAVDQVVNKAKKGDKDG